ncbi:MAG: hypothetical protein ACK4QL_11760 [Pseudanabaenaceae cyanobacterium]
MAVGALTIRKRLRQRASLFEDVRQTGMAGDVGRSVGNTGFFANRPPPLLRKIVVVYCAALGAVNTR